MQDILQGSIRTKQQPLMLRLKLSGTKAFDHPAEYRAGNNCTDWLPRPPNC
jgi:hypothetical protein